MKKLLGLTFVAVFMMSMASNQEQGAFEVKKDCFTLANNAATAIGQIYNMDHETEYYVFEQLFDDCRANN
jgi:hypothetical protein